MKKLSIIILSIFLIGCNGYNARINVGQTFDIAPGNSNTNTKIIRTDLVKTKQFNDWLSFEHGSNISILSQHNEFYPSLGYSGSFVWKISKNIKAFAGTGHSYIYQGKDIEGLESNINSIPFVGFQFWKVKVGYLHKSWEWTAKDGINFLTIGWTF